LSTAIFDNSTADAARQVSQVAKITFRSTLEPGLADLGFHRVEKFLYRSDGHGAIQHFLEFQLWGGPLNYVLCDFGMASADGHRFAVECLKLYGGVSYSWENWVPPVFGVWCQVGRFCGWGPRSSLKLNKSEMHNISDRALRDIRDMILPKAKAVTSLEAFADQILKDEPWLPWITSHGAMRAAEYIYAARRIGTDPSTILSAIEPRAHPNVKSGLDRNVDAFAFIESVLSHRL
jgi:hypothetical protein